VDEWHITGTPKKKSKMKRKPMRVTTAYSNNKDQALWKAAQQPILEIAQILKLEAAMCTEMK
jgi:hypothetical protein